MVMFCMNNGPVGQRADVIVRDNPEGQHHAENEKSKPPFGETRGQTLNIPLVSLP